jgi:hypothetical protein
LRIDYVAAQLVIRSHQLYFNLAVHREYSSPGCTGSTSTAPRVRVPRHVARLVDDYVVAIAEATEHKQ